MMPIIRKRKPTMSLLAIDIGSSRCKAVAFAVTGEILAQHATAYTPEFSAPAHAEINPEFFWQAVCGCSRAVSKDLSDPVRALCLSSHGETFVPVNGSNEAIAPAILNQDNRAGEEAAWLEKTFGRKRLFEITGLVAHPMYPVPKVLWLRKHRPGIFPPSVRFLTVIGYVLARLGLHPYIDYSLASRYLAFDIRQHRWSEEILAATEIDAKCLPVPVPAGTIAGDHGRDGRARSTLRQPGSRRDRCWPRGRLDGYLRMPVGGFRSAQPNGYGVSCLFPLLLSRGDRPVRHAGVFSLGNHDQVVPRSVVWRTVR